MDTRSVNKKIIHGFLTLTFRKAALLAIIFLVTNVWLARILPPSVIGIFNIANSILTFFAYFSDIGLAAAIIQKKEITTKELETTFTVQQILVLIISSVIFIGAPFFSQFYNLDYSAVWLIRALAVGFFLSSLKVLPSVLLERKLQFGPLVFAEILETAGFLLALVYLTYQNYGVNAYTFAVLVRAVLGTVTIYLIAPWRISVGISREAFKSLINFGIPFQLNSLLALLKDRLVPLVVARMVGPTGIGYITWSQNIAFLSLEVMNIMVRVMFPAFARLQHDERALKSTLERTIFLTGLLFYPILFGVLAIAPSLVAHVVSSKWGPALPLIYLFSINAFWAAISTSFTNFLTAIGKIGITLKLMVLWTILEWALVPVLTIYYGFYGVAIAQAIIAFTSIIPIIIVVRMIKINVLKQLWQPLSASIVMGILTYMIAIYFVFNFLSLLVASLIGGLIYLLIMIVLARDRILNEIRIFRNV